MGLKTWIVLLWILLFVKGVSFASKCSGDKNILVFLGEDIIFDIDEDKVMENTLIDGDGNDIARIQNGELTLINKHYNDTLTAKGFAFHINSTAIEGKKNFTASVLYTNKSHCTQDYSVTVIGGEICSKIKRITYILDDYFTLDFDAPGVETITWLFGSNRTIAITKDKAKLQILDSNYEGILSVINASLRKYSTIKEDVGDYTARVIFRNGTQCQQHYSVTIHDFHWGNFFTFHLDVYEVLAMLVIVLVCSVIGIRKYWLKRKEKQANETTLRTYNRNIAKENLGNHLLEADRQHHFMLQRQTI